MYEPSSATDSPVELLRHRARRLCDDILARAGATSVRAVFLGGSAARGDVWARRAAGGWEIYSDLDVYLVVSDKSGLAHARTHADAATSSLAERARGVHFLRGAEVGVYTAEDLASQPVRPGTASLAAEAFWLHGDRSVLDALAVAMARPMPPDEALYLLENRIGELASFHRAGTDRSGPLVEVAALKARLDVGAAHLIADGSWVPSSAARMESIRARTPRTMTPAVRADVESAFDLQRGFNETARNAGAAGEPEAVIALLADAWKILATEILDAPGGDAALLVRRRCKHGCVGENYREFVRVRQGLGATRFRSAWEGLTLAMFSPRTALRVHALATVLRRAEPHTRSELAPLERHVDRLTRALGFTAGSIDARVEAARRAMG